MAHLFEAHASGLDSFHPAGYAADYPHGHFSASIYVFDQPMELGTIDGVLETNAPCAMVVDGGEAIWQRGIRGTAWSNDWLFVPTAPFRHFCQLHNLTTSTVIPITDAATLAAFVAAVQDEESARRPFWQQMVDAHIRQLLYLILRNRNQPPHSGSRRADPNHREALRTLRSRAHRDLAHPWTLAEMAEAVQLSPSRFSTLYRELFGISPIEDLIRRRLDHARLLLGNRHTSVKAVALELGFANQAYFSRLFRKRFGHPPSQLPRRLD